MNKKAILTMALAVIIAGCDRIENTAPDDALVPVVVSLADRAAHLPLQGAGTRAAGGGGLFHLTINGTERTYTLSTDGNTLVPNPGDDPILIPRTATTVDVLMYGTANHPSIGGAGGRLPYIIQDAAHIVSGADKGAATLALAITPASAQVSITLVDPTTADATLRHTYTATAGNLRTPATDTNTGNYLFDTPQGGGGIISLRPTGQHPTLAIDATDGTTAPAECIATTLAAGTMLFAITADGSNESYTVLAPAGGITLVPGKNHRFTISLGHTATVLGVTIEDFATGADIDVPDVIVPDGYDVVIASTEDLAAFRDRVNNGEGGLRAIQTGDIEMTGDDWEPIGNYVYGVGGPTGTIFTGTYNGNGRTIKGLTIKNDPTNAGLFGRVGEGAILAGICLTEVEIDTGASYAGALAGQVAGTTDKPVVISHCSAAGKVTGGTRAGGLVGFIGHVHLAHCHAACTVTATGFNGNAGGLVGYIAGGVKVVAGSATGAVNTTGSDSFPGGLAGAIQANSEVYGCRATGLATASSGYDAGGFVGSNNGTITGCYATGGATDSNSGRQATFAGRNNSGANIYHCHAVPGGGAATVTVGSNNGTIDPAINTTPAQRYATITAAGGSPEDKGITVFTVRREAGTGKMVLPPEEVMYTLKGIWTEGEMPMPMP